MGLPRWCSDKDFACSAEGLDSIPGLGRSSGEGNGNPLQYSCLENPVDRGAWRATVHGVSRSRTQLNRLSTHAWKEMSMKVAWACWRSHYSEAGCPDGWLAPKGRSDHLPGKQSGNLVESWRKVMKGPKICWAEWERNLTEALKKVTESN